MDSTPCLKSQACCGHGTGGGSVATCCDAGSTCCSPSGDSGSSTCCAAGLECIPQYSSPLCCYGPGTQPWNSSSPWQVGCLCNDGFSGPTCSQTSPPGLPFPTAKVFQQFVLLAWEPTVGRGGSYNITYDTDGKKSFQLIGPNPDFSPPSNQVLLSSLKVDAAYTIVVSAINTMGSRASQPLYIVVGTPTCTLGCEPNGQCKVTESANQQCQCFSGWTGATCQTWAPWKVAVTTAGACVSFFSFVSLLYKGYAWCKRRKNRGDLNAPLQVSNP
eukprot:CAMPEP_0175133230 /NCGR_PEP_ID=MMETSP0087-20121206/7526_1 /TAXON_ID=136419 /ORGANISM="Unknown Unknown, Strain D1" /LENGTH=272 /DNA_ID=CAMNT_0016415695 /DNA_START=81 /DNA_END=899 /DNA_ORIENTATION=-